MTGRRAPGARIRCAAVSAACYSSAMRCGQYFYNGYFWFSNRIGGGETSA
ncbi:MAG TPA: hypothetical protein VIX87_01730 [Steroidobacteraceae bacterium]